MEAIETVQQPDDLADLDLEFRDELPEIVNRTQADRAMELLAGYREDEASIKEQLAAAIGRLEKRAERLVARTQRAQRFYSLMLEGWATSNRTGLLRGNAKSVNLLHGRVGWRKRGGGLKVTDKDALLAWLEAHQGLRRVKYEPDMKALQSYFEGTGEIPPGTEFEPEEDRFYADASAPENALAVSKE